MVGRRGLHWTDANEQTDERVDGRTACDRARARTAVRRAGGTRARATRSTPRAYKSAERENEKEGKKASTHARISIYGYF